MKIIFTVSTDNMTEFADTLVENDLTNEIVGTTEDDCVQIEVTYNRENRHCLENLEYLAETDE